MLKVRLSESMEADTFFAAWSGRVAGQCSVLGLFCAVRQPEPIQCPNILECVHFREAGMLNQRELHSTIWSNDIILVRNIQSGRVLYCLYQKEFFRNSGSRVGVRSTQAVKRYFFVSGLLSTYRLRYLNMRKEIGNRSRLWVSSPEQTAI